MRRKIMKKHNKRRGELEHTIVVMHHHHIIKKIRTSSWTKQQRAGLHTRRANSVEFSSFSGVEVSLVNSLLFLPEVSEEKISYSINWLGRYLTFVRSSLQRKKYIQNCFSVGFFSPSIPIFVISSHRVRVVVASSYTLLVSDRKKLYLFLNIDWIRRRFVGWMVCFITGYL
jgi:hypothetical protein